MKQIKPFNNLADAQKSLDNGGKLFNLFSRAEDGAITEAEINKAAGNSSGSQDMALFLLLATSRLIDEDKDALLGMLSKTARSNSELYAPQFLTPAVDSELEEGVNLMVHGTLKLISQSDELSAYTKKLLIAGKVPTYNFESVFDSHVVYEFTDSNTGNSMLAIHTKKHAPLENNIPYTFGCISRAYFKKKSDENQQYRLLEIKYYI